MFTEMINIVENVEANKELLDVLGIIIAAAGSIMAIILFAILIRFLLQVPTQLRRIANSLSEIADKEVKAEATIQLRRIANSLSDFGGPKKNNNMTEDA